MSTQSPGFIKTGNTTEFIADGDYFLKIEGCLKSLEYVANLIYIYLQALDSLIEERSRERIMCRK